MIGEGSRRSPKRDEVMWEVGSVSDDEDEVGASGNGEDGQKKGFGEGSGRRNGERRGLLDDDDADADKAEEDNDDHRRSAASPHDNADGDQEDTFGDYETVRRRSSDERDRNR